MQVFFGDAHHQTQVGLDHLVPGLGDFEFHGLDVVRQFLDLPGIGIVPLDPMQFFVDVLEELFLGLGALFRRQEPVPDLFLQIADLFQVGLHHGYQFKDGLLALFDDPAQVPFFFRGQDGIPQHFPEISGHQTLMFRNLLGFQVLFHVFFHFFAEAQAVHRRGQIVFQTLFRQSLIFLSVT